MLSRRVLLAALPAIGLMSVLVRVEGRLWPWRFRQRAALRLVDPASGRFVNIRTADLSLKIYGRRPIDVLHCMYRAVRSQELSPLARFEATPTGEEMLASKVKSHEWAAARGFDVDARRFAGIPIVGVAA